MNLGKRIEQTLIAKGWTQADLLRACPELERATLSAIITRDSEHSRYTVKIAKALGVRPEWLDSGEGEQWQPASSLASTPVTPREAAFIETLRGLTADQQDEVFRQIQKRAKENRDVIEELSVPRYGRK